MAELLKSLEAIKYFLMGYLGKSEEEINDMNVHEGLELVKKFFNDSLNNEYDAKDLVIDDG